jgi:tRNA threonylcarbamoyladenosine biosynthesis protein TsaB
MLILAVDTSSKTGSLALARDGEVVDVLLGDASRTHGERLPREFDRLLTHAGARLADVDYFAVVTGPGSFTGLRVGIAAVQGLAFALSKRVIPVPALEVLATAEELGRGRIGVWRDAQRQQVFAAAYVRDGRGLRELAAPVSDPPANVVRTWTAQGVAPDVMVGDGLDAYLSAARGAWPHARLITPVPPLAPLAARFARERLSSAVAPHAIVPIYVRSSDAELARDRTLRERR